MIWTVTNYLPVLSTDSFVKVDEKCFHPTLATVTQHDMHCDIMVEFGLQGPHSISTLKGQARHGKD